MWWIVVSLVACYAAQFFAMAARRERAKYEGAMRVQWEVGAALDRERERKEHWGERAREWRELYIQERKELAMVRAEHMTFLKTLVPRSIDDGASTFGDLEDDTPSMREADRLEMEERRAAQERAERDRAIREEGYQPVLVAEADDVTPPRRLDAAEDEDDGIAG
jgi:hypothetical protein